MLKEVSVFCSVELSVPLIPIGSEYLTVASVKWLITENFFQGPHQGVMDQHDLKASGMANDVRHLFSLKDHDHLGEANLFSDCCGGCPDANAGLPSQNHSCGDEIRGQEVDKLSEMERNCLVSCNDSTGENMDCKERPSSVNSTMKESVLGKEHCVKGCNGLEGKGSLKQGELSAFSLEGNASTKNLSMDSDISSDSGQPLHKKSKELVDGRMKDYWSNAGESGLKSVMQASFHERPYKTESTSSNSTHIALPASSNDSCQVTSVDVKACMRSTSSAVDTSTCTDFRSNLEEPAVQILAVGITAQASENALDSTIYTPGKPQKDSLEIVNVMDSNRVRGMMLDREAGILEEIDLQNPKHLKNKVADVSNQDKVQPSSELDDALEVARRVAREVEREVGTYREVSGSSSSVQEKNGRALHMSSVDSADSNKKDCLTETGSKIQLCCEQENCESFCSIKEVTDRQMSARHEGLDLEVKEPPHGVDPLMMYGSSDRLHGRESSYMSTKSEDVDAGDQNTHHCNIDLNESILANEEEYPEDPVNEAVFYHAKNVIRPIPAMAKSGISISLPIPHSQLGELGVWRGSAASAFRTISLSKTCNRNKPSSTNDEKNCSQELLVKGFDLNVAAEGVDFGVELLPNNCVQAQSSLASEESSMEVSSKRPRRFNIDLNFVSDNDDGYHQLSPPASLSGHSVRDFDLNDNPTSIDARIAAPQPDQGTQALRNATLNDDPAVSFMGISTQTDSRTAGAGYLTGFTSLHGFTHGHSKTLQAAASNALPSNDQMQRAHPLQHKLTYAPPPLAPPHSFLYHNGFRMDPNNSLSSTTVYPPSFLPYVTDPRGTPVIPQVLGSGPLSALSGAPHIVNVPGGPGALFAFSGAPHMMSVPGGPGPTDFAVMRPSFDLNGIGTSSENRSRAESTRQFFIPVSNSTLEEPMKSFQPVGFSATPLKRREPEGGWDSHQLSCRQVNSWR